MKSVPPPLVASVLAAAVVLAPASAAPADRIDAPGVAETDAGAAVTPPDHVRAEAPSNTSLLIRWDDQSSDETGFEVFWRDLSVGTAWQSMATGAGSTELLITGLYDGGRYEVQVASVRPGSMTFSEVVLLDAPTAQGQPVEAPTRVRAVALASGIVEVSWADASTNETEFLVERAVAGTDDWSIRGGPSADATSWIDRIGLTPAASYSYRVTALGVDTESPASPIVSVSTPDGVSVRPAPTPRMGKSIGNKQVVRWENDLAAGESFTIYAALDRDFVAYEGTVLGTGIEQGGFLNDLVDGSQVLYYKITRDTDSGSSALSEAAFGG